jgi:hypothetical protein
MRAREFNDLDEATRCLHTGTLGSKHRDSIVRSTAGPEVPKGHDLSAIRLAQ